MNLKELTEFYKNKKVLITGHTGFKGTWLCRMLTLLDAKVIGYACSPPTEPSLFNLVQMDNQMTSYIGDVRDLQHLKRVFSEQQPEIVIHMAAQPIVRESYRDPVGTYETNVMGTVNMLECVRCTSSVKSVVNVTTDKVYRNNEWEKGYVETDILDGYDPYSNSKSCSELVTHSYSQAFLMEQKVAVSTCRAGNVIGGGDFAKDRIIPDCVRAAEAEAEAEALENGMDDKGIVVRNPFSTRPYQHVLEPLTVYLMVAMKQYMQPDYASNYNVGPDDENCVATGELVSLFCELWNKENIENKKNALQWFDQSDGGPHEANFLKLDCTKLKQTFSWKPKWSIRETIEKVIEFEKLRLDNRDSDEDKLIQKLNNCMQVQIMEYLEGTESDV